MNEINNIIFAVNQQRRSIQFVWVPAHKGVEGNEEADMLAKRKRRLNEAFHSANQESRFSSNIKLI